MSTMAQCSSRRWRSATSSSAASFRRSPQPNRTPSNARSRRPFSVFGSGTCQRALAWSAV
jgi:hypothetical protein